jgi:hypothetical protein
MGHLTLHVAQTLKIFFVVEPDIFLPPQSPHYLQFMIQYGVGITGT